jgi:hypothetical protein
VCAQDFGLPPLGFGVARIHPVQVGGKDAGFVAACTRPNFHDHVLLVVGVLGEQQKAHLSEQGVQFLLDADNLLFGQLAHLLLVLELLQLAGVGQFLLEGLIAAIDLYQFLEFGLFLGILGHGDMIGRHLRIGHDVVQFFVSIFNQFNFVQHTPPGAANRVFPSYVKRMLASRQQPVETATAAMWVGDGPGSDETAWNSP